MMMAVLFVFVYVFHAILEKGRGYHHPYLLDEKIEAQRGWLICLVTQLVFVRK